MFKGNFKASLVLLILFLCASANAFGQGTAFSYQGKLTDNGNAANGQYDFQFKLFDALSAGAQQGTTQTLSNVTVSNGIFTVSLDFGVCAACFNGAARFLEIAVRPNGGGSFTTLTPRQPITSNPYAIKSMNATSADGLSVACVNCVTSSQIASVNGSAVSGLIPVASVPAGSGNYIQNTTSQQASSNFNISGNGTAGGTITGSIVNAVMQVNINGLRAFTVNGVFNNGITVFTASNTFVGDGAGLNTTPDPNPASSSGKFNSFYGAGAGQANTSGDANAFFGTSAGRQNTTGSNNAFFGRSAGQSSTNGDANAFFGSSAGGNNTTGNFNAFFGRSAGLSNTTGSQNAFFGAQAGQFNTTGIGNAFFGDFAGSSSSAGQNNTFIGSSANFASLANSTGSNNTLLGSSTTVPNSGVSNGTAIGANASVTTSNSLVLGSINGVNGCTPVNNCDSVKVGIGTTTPDAVLDVQRDGGTIPETARFTTYGTTNEILSRAAGGSRAAPTATPINRVLLQLGATGHDGADFVDNPKATILMTATENWTSAAQGTLMRFNTTANGTTTSMTRLFIKDDGNVGIGTTNPQDRLHVAGDIRVGATGSNLGCVKDDNGTLIAGACSSDARLKRDITPFAHLLDKLVQLQPVQFYWRAEEFKERHFGVKPSFGLIAQEVEKVLPELVTEDEQGYKAVNYSKLPLLTLQAIKELKQENDTLKQQLNEQQQEIEAIKRLLCVGEAIMRAKTSVSSPDVRRTWVLLGDPAMKLR